MAVKRPTMLLTVNGTTRRCFSCAVTTGSDVGAASLAISVDPADGDIGVGDDIELELGYNLRTQVFRGSVREDSMDMSPNWVDVSCSGELRLASRRTDYIDEAATALVTDGALPVEA